MFNQPRILVCTNFSEYSDYALKQAKALASKCRGELQILHVAEISFYLRWTPSENEKFSRLIYNDLMERMKTQLKRCNVEASPVVTFESNAATGISKYAQEKNIDLIVIGGTATRSTTPAFGSLARKVIAEVNCPVLVAKNDTEVVKICSLIGGNEELTPVINAGQELSYLYSAAHSTLTMWTLLPLGQRFPFNDFSPEFQSAITEETQKNLNLFRTKIKDQLKDFRCHALREN